MRNTLNRCYYLLSILFVIISSQAYCQISGLKNFRLEKDNRPVRINTLYKTLDGYLWVGTDDGVYKFDGQKYTRINFENPDYTDTVTALFQDSRLKMWVGFNSGRIANIFNQKLVYYNPEEGTPVKKISAFIEDKDNNIWFGTNGEGLYYIKAGHLYNINTDDGLSDQNVNALAVSNSGEVIAGTDQGINVCRIISGKKNIRTIGPKSGLPDYIVTSIVPGNQNSFWIGMQDNGFCLYNINTDKIILPGLTGEWGYGQINAMLSNREYLWLGTEQNGLIRFHITTHKLSVQAASAKIQQINNLKEDNQGNIWVVSPEFGLSRSAEQKLTLTKVPESTDFEHIHAILSDQEENLWLNDQNNALLKLSFVGETNQVDKIIFTGVDKSIDITSLYQDNYGNIWVGSMGRGLFIVDPFTMKYRSFTDNPLFKDASVLSISGSANSVFVSSLQGIMEIVLSDDNRKITNPYRYTNFENSGTGSNYIYSIFKDSKQRIWFATDGSGLTMLFKNSFTYFNDRNVVRDDHIYSITEDKAGNIWFSTADAGIYKYDGVQFTNYGLKEGLSDLSISVVTTDKAGNIVIVHKTSIDILNPLTGNFTYLNKNQGVSEINAEDLGAVTKDTHGKVLISTKEGILHYDPPGRSIDRPQVILESIQLFLKEIVEGSANKFKYDENNFSFYFTGLYYSDPENIFYQYKLDGLDSNWVTTRDKVKHFPKLNPGNYTFRIRASLNQNFNNADEAHYSFIIKKPFFAEWWFLLACAGFGAGMILLIIKFRESGVKKMERLRQEKIQFQFELLRNQVNPHFLFNSFNTLISTIEENPRKAVEYTEQLSDYFRNIVNYRDKEIIGLQEELQLLSTYFYLQQMRHGDNIQLKINFSESQMANTFIPPMTLQLLLENAIKHNRISKSTQLVVSLDMFEDDFLRVTNNIHPMLNKLPGSGMGLQNIINRFNMLTHRRVIISQSDDFFIVSLPLLKKTNAKDTDHRG